MQDTVNPSDTRARSPKHRRESSIAGTWLFIRGGALGDILLTEPSVRRVRLVADRLVLVTAPRIAALWTHIAFDRVIDIGGQHALFLHGFGSLPEQVDHAVTYTYEQAAQLRALGVPDVRWARPKPPSGVHILRHLASPLRDLPAVIPSPIVTTPRPQPEAPAIVLAPGAGSPSKQWRGFPSLAQRLTERGFSVKWCLGRDEAFRPPNHLGEVLPIEPLPVLAQRAASCDAWVGNDTGTTHLAAATGAQVITMFGPTDPRQWASPNTTVFTFDTPTAEVAAFIEENVRRPT